MSTAAPTLAPARAATAPAAALPTPGGKGLEARRAGEIAEAVIRSKGDRARVLGEALAASIDEPERFAAELAAAWHELADPDYRAGQAHVAPGIGPTHGVRTPLQVALRKGFEKATRRSSTAQLLFVADRLLREPEREARWFAITTLQRTLGKEPERTWQLLRRAARDADDWITVDTLAHPFGKGILNEPYRWAELEQLTVSPSRWERRLVGSTIATMPFVNRTVGRTPATVAHGLELLGTLIGDAEPDVQKALAWGYRSMAMVDPAAASRALEAEAEIAAATQDGHRAWVVRDSLSKLPRADAARIRARLGTIRRRAGAASTSRAAELTARFGDMDLGRRMPEPPLHEQQTNVR